MLRVDKNLHSTLLKIARHEAQFLPNIYNGWQNQMVALYFNEVKEGSLTITGFTQHIRAEPQVRNDRKRLMDLRQRVYALLDDMAEQLFDSWEEGPENEDFEAKIGRLKEGVEAFEEILDDDLALKSESDDEK
jgi:hypothetical protein